MTSLILDTQESLLEFWQFVQDNINDIDVVAFDLETNSKEEIKADVYGIGLAFQDEEGFYIPVRAKDGSFFFSTEQTAYNIEAVTNLLLSKKIIGHNLVYDTVVWKHRYGVSLYDNIYADTILMKHCIDEERPFGLKEVAVKYLGPGSDKAQQALYDNIKANGGSITKTNMEMYKADTQVLGEYCCHDVMLTYKLFNLFSIKLKEENLEQLFYLDEVMPLYKEVTIPMKEKGIPIDIELFTDMLKQADADEALLQKEIYESLRDLVFDFEVNFLNEEFPIKKTGNFPKAYASIIGIPLDSTAKKIIQNLEVSDEVQLNFKQWMLGDVLELSGPTLDAQMQLMRIKFERPTCFSVGSKLHLKWLFFDKLGLEPLTSTEKGEPQIDDAFLSSIAADYPWISKLRDLNTILKMKSTYLEGILERQVSGTLYASFLQFGTTSGRFASNNPNLQNCPAPQNTGSIVDKYVNCIRKGIIARPGYKLIGADFSSLEPHIAAYVSGDPDLIDIFVTGKDFYSAIAIKQFDLGHLSAFKNDSNYLGDADKATRDKTKTYSLAAFYGASEFRIAQVLGCTVEEAKELLEGYLKAFPGIKRFISKAHYDACHKGYVSTIFGRIRHLNEARQLFKMYGHDLLNIKWARSKGMLEQRGVFKNLLNNAVNFQIQGTAGHVMNRAMLLTKRNLEAQGIDATIVMTIHDEQIVEVRADQVELASSIIKQAMETCVNLGEIKLKATPIIGDSYGDCK